MKPSEIVDGKEALRLLLVPIAYEALAIAYGALGEGKSPRELAKELKKLELRHKAKRVEAREITRATLIVAKAVRKRLPPDADIALLPLIAFRAMKRMGALSYVSKNAVNPSLRRFEEREKKKYVESLYKALEPLPKGYGGDGSLLVSPKKARKAIFYMASSHGDCAEDHKEWQGRLYVDAEWRSKASGHPRYEEIARKAKALVSVQAVTIAPAWFVARPNCRHYLHPVNTDDALDKGEAQLTREYGLFSPVGKRGARQTIRHDTRKGWYTRENVEGIIRKYRERLSYLKTLRKRAPNEELDRDIEKTRFMIEKWTAYLKRLV